MSELKAKHSQNYKNVGNLLQPKTQYFCFRVFIAFFFLLPFFAFFVPRLYFSESHRFSEEAIYNRTEFQTIECNKHWFDSATSTRDHQASCTSHGFPCSYQGECRGKEKTGGWPS